MLLLGRMPSKIISELLAVNYGRDKFKKVVIFRPHNVFGPDMGWEHVVPQFILRAHDSIKKQPEGPINFPIQGQGTETFADGRSYVGEFKDDKKNG